MSFILLCSCSDHRKATKSIRRSYATCDNKQRTYNTYRIFSVRINYLTHQASLAIVSFGPFWESMRDEVGLVAAKCELPLVPARVQSIVPRTRAIDRFSCSRHWPTGALANQNAAPHLRQSGRLIGHHAEAAKCEFKSHSRALRLNTNASS